MLAKVMLPAATRKRCLRSGCSGIFNDIAQQGTVLHRHCGLAVYASQAIEQHWEQQAIQDKLPVAGEMERHDPIQEEESLLGSIRKINIQEFVRVHVEFPVICCVDCGFLPVRHAHYSVVSLAAQLGQHLRTSAEPTCLVCRKRFTEGENVQRCIDAQRHFDDHHPGRSWRNEAKMAKCRGFSFQYPGV